jgi:hypothetical protein
MRKILSGVIAAGFVATVGLSAQEPPPSSAPGAGGAQRQAPASQAPSSQSSASKTVTLSGCIQNAPGASASGSAAGASASASAAPKFVLATKSAASGAAGGGAAVGTSGSAMRYQLDGDDKSISPHLNHEVEITGTVQPSAGGGAAGAGGGASASGPTLKVESVKMVAATCS